MIVMLGQFKVVSGLHRTAVTFPLKGFALDRHCLQTIARNLLTVLWIRITVQPFVLENLVLPYITSLGNGFELHLIRELGLFVIKGFQ